MSSKFVHLHTHSHYSLLDGLTKLEEMVDIAKKNDQTAIALTDHGNLYGAIEFYKAATGKLPVAGAKSADLIGKGVVANVTNENKVSKKGTAYVRTTIKDIAAVHPKLVKEIVPLDKLKPAFEAALAKSSEKADAKDDSANAPF